MIYELNYITEFERNKYIFKFVSKFTGGDPPFAEDLIFGKYIFKFVSKFIMLYSCLVRTCISHDSFVSGVIANLQNGDCMHITTRKRAHNNKDISS